MLLGVHNGVGGAAAGPHFLEGMHGRKDGFNGLEVWMRGGSRQWCRGRSRGPAPLGRLVQEGRQMEQVLREGACMRVWGWQMAAQCIQLFPD